MARETIEFGIDLGTTNSAVAMAAENDAAVLRNNLQQEYTPSVVWITEDQVYVGDDARKWADSDQDNVCAEFKLKMGDPAWRHTFPKTGRKLSAPELSAEVLKSLRGDVQAATGEIIDASVITVPAAFELDQCEATRKAAELAGLTFAPLLQEPTAAAWAYSTRASTDTAYWLVYDLGGGTFDAAVLSVRDGEFIVVNHAGDNFLGGKLIDWAVVEDVLIPAARDAHGLHTLARGDTRWRHTVGTLKKEAERAKIRLSRYDTTRVETDLDDGKGGKVTFSHKLSRSDVDRAAAPFYAKSIALCRQALAEKGLGPGDIERVLLVGGATLSPTLRELLKDPDQGLGITLDHSLDPVTVVARGAAIFASTQRMPRGSGKRKVDPGQAVLDLKHDLAGQETEPLVGGTATIEPNRSWSGHTIEFVNDSARPAWHSGQVPLGADGTFRTRLLAQERTTNTYTITLRDPQGVLLATDPSTLSYRHTPLRGGNPVLIHSVGVGLEDNTVAPLLEKNTELPAKKRVILYTVVEVRRNERTGLIRVPIVEGERPRADRNTLIGRLDVRPHEVKRDVPIDSEVEVTIHINESFEVRADAYVPVLDEEFAIDVELGRDKTDVALLRKGAAELESRHTALYGQATEVNATDALERLAWLESSGKISEISSLVAAAEVDADAAATCQARLRDAQTVLDEVEQALQLPQLIQDSAAMRQSVGQMVRDSGDLSAQQQLREAEAALDRAIAARDFTVIQRQVEVIRIIGVRMLDASGQLPAVMFGIYENELADDPNPRVQSLLNEGRAAVNNGNTARLRTITAQLRQLAPVETQVDSMSVTSTVRKGSQR